MEGIGVVRLSLHQLHQLDQSAASTGHIFRVHSFDRRGLALGARLGGEVDKGRHGPIMAWLWGRAAHAA